MKKVILFVASFFAANLFAATDAQIINHFKNTIQVPNISVEVVERHSVEGVAGMDFVTLNLSDGIMAALTGSYYDFPKTWQIRTDAMAGGHYLDAGVC